MEILYLWDKTSGLGLDKASSYTTNLVPSVEFPYPTLVIMMHYIILQILLQK
jgi:hypothetical protein